MEEEEEEEKQPKQTVCSAVWADRRDREELEKVRGGDCISSDLTLAKKNLCFLWPRRDHVLSLAFHNLSLTLVLYFSIHIPSISSK